MKIRAFCLFIIAEGFDTDFDIFPTLPRTSNRSRKWLSSGYLYCQARHGTLGQRHQMGWNSVQQQLWLPRT
jgi:hypothetical protein